MEIEAPLCLHSEKILPEWMDYNGHMNLTYYVLVFDHATDAFLDFAGLTEQFRNANHSSTFAAEIHVTYKQEVAKGDEVYVKTQLLDFDEKRIHFFHTMYDRDNEQLVATNELISLYMDMRMRKVTTMPEIIQEKLGQIRRVHELLPAPPEVGGTIGIRRTTRQP